MQTQSRKNLRENDKIRRKRKYMELVLPNQVNPELLPMIRQGLISPEKLAILVDLAEIVDRFSTTLFTEVEVQEKLKEQFGVLPDIITWGTISKPKSLPDIFGNGRILAKDRGYDPFRFDFRAFDFCGKTGVL